jgi:hypothetical protein
MDKLTHSQQQVPQNIPVGFLTPQQENTGAQKALSMEEKAPTLQQIQMAFFAVVKAGDVEKAKQYIAKGADLNKPFLRRSVLDFAFLGKSEAMIIFVLESVDPNLDIFQYCDQLFIYSAANSTIARLISDWPNSQKTSQSSTAIASSASLENVQAKVLAVPDFDVLEFQELFMSQAKYNTSAELAKLLESGKIDSPFFIRTINNISQTPLGEAVKKNNLDAMKFILAQPKTYLMRKIYLLAFQEAMYSGSIGGMEILLQHYSQSYSKENLAEDLKTISDSMKKLGTYSLHTVMLERFNQAAKQLQ